MDAETDVRGIATFAVPSAVGFAGAPLTLRTRSLRTMQAARADQARARLVTTEPLSYLLGQDDSARIRSGSRHGREARAP